MSHGSSSKNGADPYKGEPAWVRFVTGGAASCTAEVATLPVDMAKIRLQLQATGTKVYKNMFHCIYQVGKEEGLSALYKGLSPALLRQATYSSIRMGIYEPIRNVIAGDIPVNEIPFWMRTMAGGTAGALGIAIANPTELIKVRMQGDKLGTRYPNGVVDAFRQTIKGEGVTGLWKGVGPNMLRAYIVNAAELASYDQAKTLLIDKAGLNPDSKATHLVSSLIAGVVAAVCSQPVDLVKNRYMNQPAGKDALYTGIFDCFIKTAKREGVTGLYKGLTANAARIGSWCVVMFMSYEQFRIAARGLYVTDGSNKAGGNGASAVAKTPSQDEKDKNKDGLGSSSSNGKK